jgi:large subunit ribosomal protein L3
MRMAGRMGGERVTLQNLKVLKVMRDENVLIVKGAVPGPRNSYLEISN